MTDHMCPFCGSVYPPDYVHTDAECERVLMLCSMLYRAELGERP